MFQLNTRNKSSFRANQRIQLQIRDTGAGLTPQDIKKLFTPFERLNAANSQIEGTGLGLVISQRLITAMAGNLGVESVWEQGSTFWIELPEAQLPLEALAAASSVYSKANSGEAGRTYTVLSIHEKPPQISGQNREARDVRAQRIPAPNARP